MKKIFPFGFLLFAIVGCNTNSTTESKNSSTDTPAVSAPVTGDNSMNALDWQGTYKGIVPCADCEGIETVITIGADSLYTLTLNYLGKKDAVAVKKSGRFNWNATGNIITLSNIEGGADKYLVGENKLIQLDLEGNRITGDLAAKYELAKQ